MEEGITVILSAIGSTVTILGALLVAARWLNQRLEYVNQIPELKKKVDELDAEVKDAIGVKRHLQELLTRVATLEHILSEHVSK